METEARGFEVIWLESRPLWVGDDKSYQSPLFNDTISFYLDLQAKATADLSLYRISYASQFHGALEGVRTSSLMAKIILACNGDSA